MDLQLEEQSGPRARYVSAAFLAIRWCVSVTTVHRWAEANGFATFFGGEGPNATVRYLLSDVLAYEAKRTIKRTR